MKPGDKIWVEAEIMSKTETKEEVSYRVRINHIDLFLVEGKNKIMKVEE